METKISCMHVVSFRAICTWCMYVVEKLEMTTYSSCIWKMMYYVGGLHQRI